MPMRRFNITGPFERVCATNRRLASRIAILSLASIAGLFTVARMTGVRINTTPSLPVGLYIETTATSDLVEFCPSEPYASFAARRGYRTQGSCPDGVSPLLKPIVAKPGDTVQLSSSGITVNNRLLPNTAPLIKDSASRPLQHFPFGRYIVTSGQVWVASTYNRRSFDSRYFGAVPVSAIRAHLRSLLTR